jgi:hypothetical protein
MHVHVRSVLSLHFLFSGGPTEHPPSSIRFSLHEYLALSCPLGTLSEEYRGLETSAEVTPVPNTTAKRSGT